MPPWLLVDTQPDTLDTRVTRDTPVTCVTRDTRMPMGTGKENDAPVRHPGGVAAQTYVMRLFLPAGVVVSL